MLVVKYNQSKSFFLQEIDPIKHSYKNTKLII